MPEPHKNVYIFGIFGVIHHTILNYELSERVDREQRLVEQRFHKDEDTSQTTMGSLENLKKNVKELFAEYNDRH